MINLQDSQQDNLKDLNANFIQINEGQEQPVEEKPQPTYTEPESKPMAQSWYSCLTVEYYQPFFDVDEQIVLNRLKHGFLPQKGTFLNKISDNPDLYGPFWILTSLVFVVAAVGNFSRLMAGEKDFYFGFVPTAAALIYSFGLCTPVFLAFLMRLFGSEQVGYVQVICLYGYSNTVFLPVTALCVLPFQSSQWVLLCYGLINSCAFLIINLWTELGQYINKRRYIIMGITVGVQVVMVLMYKFYFFSHIIYSEKP